MKKTVVTLAIVFSLTGSSCKEKSTQITLSGKIENAGASPLLLADDEYSDTYDTIPVKNGEFSISIILDHPGFKYLIMGKTRKEIFFAPGYSINVRISKTAVPDSSSFKIEGEGAAENYILDSVLKAENKLDYAFMRAATPAIASAYIDSSYKSLLAYVDELGSSLDPAFAEYKKADLAYGAASFKTHIGMQKEISDPAYYSFLRNIEIENEKYMNVPGYRGFMDSYLNSRTHLMVPADIADDHYLDSLLVVIDGLKSKKIREYYLFNKISMFVGEDLVNSEKYRLYFETHNTDTLYAKTFRLLLAEKLVLSAGKEAPPFTLEDADNKKVSLSDFKGKIVLLDFWATWCHPCMEEMPHFMKLQSDYKDKGIVFLSILIEEDKKIRENYPEESGTHAGSLHGENGAVAEVSLAYHVNAIPLFTLIDKEGRIIRYSAPQPSSKEIRILLDSLVMIHE